MARAKKRPAKKGSLGWAVPLVGGPYGGQWVRTGFGWNWDSKKRKHTDNLPLDDHITFADGTTYLRVGDDPETCEFVHTDHFAGDTEDE